MSPDLFIFTTLLYASVAQAVVVDTEYGQVRGHQLEVDNGASVSTVDVFYGIPFAADTSGENRFRNPVKRSPWSGVFEADTIGAACPQGSGGNLAITHPDWDKFGEDCLHVNIYSPNVAGGPYPVMAWFHGGAYSSGANFQYPGHFLATYDVVVVTVNYRLNKFGFAFTNSSACPGNAGLWDQRLGLEFIRDNIANFGGDPGRVTIFGESAGASSSSLHILSPQSKDLFHQAIMESGAETNPWAIRPPGLNPEGPIYEAADRIGCNRTTDEEMMDCLRSKTWEDIYRNTSSFGGAPVVDGPGGFLPYLPAELRERGDIMTGPIITGINHDDASLFVPGFAPETILGCCNRTYFRRIVENRLVGLIGFFLDNVTQEKVTEAIMFNYSPWPDIYSRWGNRNALIEIATDAMFGASWNDQLLQHQEVGPTYGYVYNYRGRNTSSLIPEWMGVPHVAELPYVWGHTLLPRNPAIQNDSLIFLDLFEFTEEDIAQTIYLQTLWTNFAKYGNPTPTPVPDPIGGETVWSQFTYEETNVLEIRNVSMKLETGWRQRDYAFWKDYVENLGPTESQADTFSELYAFLDVFLDYLLAEYRSGGSVFDEEYDAW